LARVTKNLSAQGVHAHTLDRYYFGQRRLSGVVLGLGVVEVEQARRGLSLLKRELQRYAHSK
jgi:GntR family transcriptional regulator/MocR family aminotransferase